MKQHITPDQLIELSSQQFGNLCDLCEIPDGMTVSIHAFGKTLNIGKMIEILSEKYEDVKMSNEGYSDNVWSVSVDMGLIFTMGEELCDVLWDVVKSTL